MISSFDLSTGGPPRVALRLAAGAALLGHNVTTLSYDCPPDRRQAMEQDWAEVPGAGLVHRRLLPRPGRIENVLAVTARRELAQFLPGFDIVHTHDLWSGIGRAAMSMAVEHGIGFVLLPHGMLDPWSLRQKKLKKKFYLASGYRRVLDKALFLQALNLDEKIGIGQTGLKPPVEIIPNGVYPEEFSPLPQPGLFVAKVAALQGKRFIYFLSRLHYKKGLDYLGAAFALLADKHPDLHLVVAGPDDGAGEPFRQQVRAAGLESRVHMIGATFSRERYHAMIDSACFCLPSRQEGFSVAILEAMACARPVVISAACHFPEVAASCAGEVVSLEAPAVAASLDKILSNPDLARQMGENGRRMVMQQFTWPRVAEMLIAAYDRHLGRTNPAIATASQPL